MGTARLTVLAVAIVIGIPVVSALAAQRFDQDCATQPAQAMRAPARLGVKRMGHDALFVTRDTLVTRPDALQFSGIVPKPGRA